MPWLRVLMWANPLTYGQAVLSRTILGYDAVQTGLHWSLEVLLMLGATGKTADLALSLGVDEYLVASDSRTLLLSRAFAGRLEFHVNWPRKFVN